MNLETINKSNELAKEIDQLIMEKLGIRLPSLAIKRNIY